VGFFMGQLIGVKTPPKSHGVLCFKVRHLKNYNQYRCTFWLISYGQKIQPSHGKSLRPSFKKWLSKVRTFGRSGVNWHTVFTKIGERILPHWHCSCFFFSLSLFLAHLSWKLKWAFLIAGVRLSVRLSVRL
jgi:hypothetical protein